MTKTLPAGPLLDAARHGRPWHTGTHCTSCTRYTNGSDQALCITNEEAGRIFGVHRTQIERWRRPDARIDANDPSRIDALAAATGHTPYEIWPELLDQAVAEVTRTCAGPSCTEEFVITNHSRLYCSRRCRKRALYQRNRDKYLAQMRDRWASDADYRETKKCIDAAYKREVRAAARARQMAA